MARICSSSNISTIVLLLAPIHVTFGEEPLRGRGQRKYVGGENEAGQGGGYEDGGCNRPTKRVMLVSVKPRLDSSVSVEIRLA